MLHRSVERWSAGEVALRKGNRDRVVIRYVRHHHVELIQADETGRQASIVERGRCLTEKDLYRVRQLIQLLYELALGWARGYGSKSVAEEADDLSRVCRPRSDTRHVCRRGEDVRRSVGDYRCHIRVHAYLQTLA